MSRLLLSKIIDSFSPSISFLILFLMSSESNREALFSFWIANVDQPSLSFCDFKA
jgi:hypothetical protein